MTTYEWLTIIGVLLGGFSVVCKQLIEIRQSLEHKVGFKECSEKREKCPCIDKIAEIQKTIEEQHPRSKNGRFRKRTGGIIAFVLLAAVLAGGCTAAEVRHAVPIIEFIWGAAGEFLAGEDI